MKKRPHSSKSAKGRSTKKSDDLSSAAPMQESAEATRQALNNLQASQRREQEISLKLQQALPPDIPANPFVCSDPDYPIDLEDAKVDLAEFVVEDDWIEDALQFQLSKQYFRDGIQFLSRSFSLRNNTSIKEEWSNVFEIAIDPYKRKDYAIPLSITKKPAAVSYLDRGLPRNFNIQEIEDGLFGNRRTWFIGITMNRDKSALAFVNWMRKDFIRFIYSVAPYMANIDMKGGALFTNTDVNIVKEFIANDKISERLSLERWLADKKAAQATAVHARTYLRTSIRDIRARLLALACYRVHQAGWDWRKYDNEQRKVGLERAKMTEANWRHRLKLADKILRQDWSGLLSDGTPDITPGVVRRPIRHRAAK